MFKIEEVTREGAKLVLCLAGVSGGGKTYSALQLAYGLARKDASKVGFLDTENRRGRLYADCLQGKAKFKIADMIAPFHPDRYIEGIKTFEDAGCEVLIIDSGSHEWNGIGGCDEIANDGNPKVARWNIAKMAHKKFVNHLLQSSMHVIVCLRAQEKVDMKDPRNIRSLGVQPVCEKNFMFEMTASLMMEDNGTKQRVLKCPAELMAHLGRGTDYLTAEDGLAVRNWVDGGNPIDRELERHRTSLMTACEYGTDALKRAWEELPKTAQHALKGELANLKASAESYENHRSLTGFTDEEPAALTTRP